jgi:hypothetical protein
MAETLRRQDETIRKQQVALDQLETVREVNATLANELETLRSELRQLHKELAILPDLIAATGKPPSDERLADAVKEFKTSAQDAIQSTDLGKCLANQGLSIDALADSKSYAPMTPSQLQERANRLAACSSDIVCKAGDAACKEKIDKTMRHLAVLLKLVGLVFSVTGNPEIGVPLMMMADGLEKGEGDGKGKSDSATPTDRTVADQKGTSSLPCGKLCRSMNGLAAVRVGTALTVIWKDGSKTTFDLGVVPQGPNEQTDFITADESAKVIHLHRCVPPARVGDWGGVTLYRITVEHGQKPVTKVGSEDIKLSEGSTCSPP